MSDKPRTDSAIRNSDGQWSYPLRDTCQQLERELAEAREQRDTLAEALEHMLTHGETHQPPLRNTISNIAFQALAAVKGGDK